MISYEAAVKKLASDKAHDYLDGAYFPSAKDEEAVAWIFEVSPETLAADIDALYPAMLKKISGYTE